LKWQLVAAVVAVALVEEHQVVPMEKARQDFQVVEAVTQDHNLIQVQEVAEEEPQQYTSMAQR
tara:strand:+ start:185 stop:373 length:189 start_codon:yes stop_codon:yes gene_type:complete